MFCSQVVSAVLKGAVGGGGEQIKKKAGHQVNKEICSDGSHVL